MKLALCLLLACSSRPAPPVPADAGSECAECRDWCGKTTSDRDARLCSFQCDVVCESEGR